MGSGQGEAAPRTSPAHVFACVTGQESSMKKLINSFGSEAHRHPVYSQLSSHLTPTPPSDPGTKSTYVSQLLVTF